MSEDEMDMSTTDPAGRVDRTFRAPRFSWTPAYETTFFRSLCDSVHLGLRENSSFKAEAWERAALALQDAHGAYPTKSHLINKSDNARKRFRLWRGLRENPDFAYNPVTKTVSASDDAWAAHIEKESLSRALRGRPFDHEEFMEILYPDVIGSGGAPKRIMKPRRRTDGQLEDSDMPGTGVINLGAAGATTHPSGTSTHTDARPTPNSITPTPRPSLSQTPTGSSQDSAAPPMPPSAAAPSAPTLSAPLPPLGAAGNSSSALTPPDETLLTAQGKLSQGASAPVSALPTVSKSPMPSPAIPTTAAHPLPPSSPLKRRRTSSRGAAAVPGGGFPRPTSATAAQVQTTTSVSAPPVVGTPAPPGTSTRPATMAASIEDSNGSGSSKETSQEGSSMILQEMLHVLKSQRTSSQWREDALDIFFRDFPDEDLDLQIQISEGLLTQEHKAMVFCKMPVRVRQHWVSKLRNMHSGNA